MYHTAGFKDTGDYWRSAYESATFQEDLEKLLTELKPLYAQLHTYVRNQLRSLYGADKFPRSGHIPAHLLGKQNKKFVPNNNTRLFIQISVLSLLLFSKRISKSPFCEQVFDFNFFNKAICGLNIGTTSTTLWFHSKIKQMLTSHPQC